MFSALRKRITYANVAATLALLFAMTGGAYAASRVLITSTKQIKPSVLKQLTGRTGPTGRSGSSGSAGPAGPSGPGGPQGPAGAKGENGAPGSVGEKGANGESVTNTPLAKGSTTCKEGGAEFKVGSGTATHACNGTTGFTETLPKEKTETGTFGDQFVGEKEHNSVASISFAIPLAAPLDEAHVHYVNTAEQASKSVTSCQGTVEAPTAAKGNLCLYQGATEEPLAEVTEPVYVPTITSPDNLGEGGAGTAGALAHIHYAGPPEEVLLQGSWAVTAP